MDGHFICVGTTETGPEVSVKVYIGVYLAIRSDLQARKVLKEIFIK